MNSEKEVLEDWNDQDDEDVIDLCRVDFVVEKSSTEQIATLVKSFGGDPHSGDSWSDGYHFVISCYRREELIEAAKKHPAVIEITIPWKNPDPNSNVGWEVIYERN